MNHKAWLDNEYQLWIEALQESTVHNFKEHPQVKRMLSEVDRTLFLTEEVANALDDISTLLTIDNIGRKNPLTTLSGTCLRMIYYALKVLEKEPKSIVEIGGGVGQFYAILRALGFEGYYYISDLPKVQEFQRKYLNEVESLTGLKLPLVCTDAYEMCVSFYALGEFDDELKAWYIKNVINTTPHGFVVWNPHSQASEEINFKHKLTIEPGIDAKIITW